MGRAEPQKGESAPVKMNSSKVFLSTGHLIPDTCWPQLPPGKVLLTWMCSQEASGCTITVSVRCHNSCFLSSPCRCCFSALVWAVDLFEGLGRYRPHVSAVSCMFAFHSCLHACEHHDMQVEAIKVPSVISSVYPRPGIFTCRLLE